ncbi:MAG TPA: hypothetical protein VJ904_00910 [Tichowtungia sp.]|nr:hypothetical protein [Tichowtungia sp.]
MRIATITAKTKDGQWVTLALPGVPLHEQKAFFKQLKQDGGVIELNGKPVELEEAHLFVSGNGKRIRFKDAQTGVSAPQDDGVKNLDELAGAVGVERKELDVIRKLDGFPGEKMEDGSYDVDAIQAFIEAQAGTGE